VATAHANEQYAEDQLAYTRLNAGSQIATALSGYAREQALVSGILPGMDERALRNAAIISDAYHSGGADLLRYLDAERMLIDTRLLSMQTWTDYQKAVVSLHLAYGEQP
jgi:outer membrane protein TolC